MNNMFYALVTIENNNVYKIFKYYIVIKYKSKPFRTALPSGEVDYKLDSFPGDNPVIVV